MLENMKLFFDIEGFVFVVGLDVEVINRAIEARYPPRTVTGAGGEPETTPMVDGTEYIKKLFQVPHALPAIDPDQLHGLLQGLANTPGLPPEQQADITERISWHLEYLDDTRINPRDVKRLINAYTLHMKLLAASGTFTPDPDIALAIQVMSTRADWQYLWYALSADPDVFLTDLRAEEFLAGRPIPPRFLDYVHNVVERMQDESLNIEPYIAIVESSRQPDHAVLASLREITALHTREIRDGLPPDRDAVVARIDRARDAIDRAAKGLASSSSTRTPAGQAVTAQLTNFALPMVPGRAEAVSSPQFADEWNRFVDSLTEIAAGLQRMRQASEIGATAS
jgi:hypothetical protein